MTNAKHAGAPPDAALDPTVRESDTATTPVPDACLPDACLPKDVLGGYVAFVRWPTEAGERTRLADLGVPRLLLVESGAMPPDDWSADEDWIRIPADPVDLHHRAETLRRRSGVGEPDVVIDDNGLVRRGDRWVALAPVELSLVTALVDRRGQLVRRSDLRAAAWPDERLDHRALDRGIARARSKLRRIDVDVHCIPSCGYLLEVLCSEEASEFG